MVEKRGDGGRRGSDEGCVIRELSDEQCVKKEGMIWEMCEEMVCSEG